MTDKNASPWTLAHRAGRMNPSIIREILKVTEQPGVLSMAGGLPSPDTFPIEAMREASAKVLADSPREALQYAASEGYGPLREWVAATLNAQGQQVSADRVLITTGSQQALDLIAKVLVDAGAPVAVETPTYLGALQAFAPFEPLFTSVASDDQGPLPDAISALPHDAPGTRFLYVLPNFQNPTGRVMGEARRQAVVAAAQAARVPLVEDNPYGDLWFDQAPAAPLAARWPEGTVYMGSFSKVLAPGLRLGYVVAPAALTPKLLQAKQAADLHTPSFNQRMVYEVIRNGFLDQHIPTIRARYKTQRDTMAQALTEHMPAGTEWAAPQGGMFFWLRLPAGCNAMAQLPKAVAAGVAFVPGEPFYAHAPDIRTMRLSFVTLTPDEIRYAVATLGSVLKKHLQEDLAEATP
ncbi:PLP-dependent aminotransferase family protein [Ideonella sp.]|uniref:aminotransferase-like domain-containing protein n=1 Tax=Ideonella sp. TaxID=1929293 RepID=UPI002C01762C|nr:PLP-dependent aminotransferase family protein [Ramlibacter sp.]